MTSKPTIYYFPIQGRAEVVRLAFSYLGVDYDDVPVDYAEMKSNREKYPFGQCPVLVDGPMTLAQSGTIIRHIGHKYNLYGDAIPDKAMIDMILEGIEAIRQRYSALIYVTQMADKDEYFAKHVDKAGAPKSNGANFDYLLSLVKKNAGNNYAVGTTLSMADLALYNITDLHQRLFGDAFKAQYPELVAHFEFIGSLPAIKAYETSGKKPAKVNNSVHG